MAVTFEDFTGWQTDYGTEITTITMPSTRPDGNLFFFLFGKDDIQTVTLTGWTEDLHETNGSTHSLHIFSRVGSSEPATYGPTNTWTGSEPTNGGVLRFSGADTFVITSANANSSTMTAPAGSPTPASDALILRLWALEDDNPGDNPPSGHTTYGFNHSTAGGQDLFVAYAISDTLGDTSSAAWGGTYADNWCAATVEIKAAASSAHTLTTMGIG